MYKDYEAVVRVDNKNETLSMLCKNLEEAKKLTNSVYDGYIKAKLITNYKVIGVYLKSRERTF